MADDHLLLDGALGEHIGFSFKVSLTVQHLQGREEVVGIVGIEDRFVGPGVDEAILGDEGIIEGVELLLLALDFRIGVVLRLVLNELAHTVTETDEALNAALCCYGGIHGAHDAVLTVVYLSVHHCEAKVSHGGISRDGEIFLIFLQFHILVLFDTAVNILDSIQQLLTQVHTVICNAGRLWPKGSADLLHLAQNHVGVINKVLIHLQPVGIHAQMDPIGLVDGEGIPLLEEENVGSDVGAGCILECVVGQADRPQKVSPLRHILAERGVVLVQRTLTGDKGDDTSGPHLVQGLGKEVVVNEEIVLIIPLVHELEVAEGNITDGNIKKAVREVCVFKPLNSDRGLLIELLGDTPTDTVQLNAIDLGVGKGLRPHTHKVTDAARGLQQIAPLEADLLQSLIHGSDDLRRRVESGQRRFSGGVILYLGKEGLQLAEFAVPVIEAVGKATPANILSQNSLLVRRGQPVFFLQLLQEPDCSHIPIEPFAGSTDTNRIIRDLEVVALGHGNFGKQNRRGHFPCAIGLGRLQNFLFLFSLCQKLSNSVDFLYTADGIALVRHRLVEKSYIPGDLTDFLHDKLMPVQFKFFANQVFADLRFFCCGLLLSNPLHIRRDLLDKRGILQLLRVYYLTVDDAVFFQPRPYPSGVNVVQLIVRLFLLLDLGNLLVGHVNEVGKVQVLQFVVNQFLEGVVLAALQ